MAKKSESYESMLKRLEKLVNDMDKSELTLDESMKDYEEGIKIYNKLYKILSDDEVKIKILKDGSEEDFDYNKENKDEN